MKHYWTLRILNTEHAGAEVDLIQSMLLGSDEEQADLVLKADFISLQLLTLTPEEEGVKLQIHDQEARLRTLDTDLEIDQYMPVQTIIFVGELALAIKGDSEQWTDSILAFPITAENSSNKKLSSTVNAALNIPLKGKTFSYYWHLPLVRLICGVVVILTVSLLIFDFSNSPHVAANEKEINGGTLGSTTLLNNKPIPLPEVTGLLENKDYSHVVLRTEAGLNTVHASGYVDNDVILDRLREQLNKIYDLVNLTVYSNEKIKNSARLILSSLGVDAEEIKQSGAAGSFTAVIDGDYMKIWKNAKHLIMNDVPGVKVWGLELKQTLTPVERLKSIAQNHSIANKLSYVDNTQKIQIVAYLNDEEQKVLATLMAEFRARIGDYPKLEHVTPNMLTRKLTLNDFGITAVRSGNTPYVTYRNGKRYLLGARLPNGISIQQFTEGEITVLRGVESYVVNYQATPLKQTEVAYQNVYNL